MAAARLEDGETKSTIRFRYDEPGTPQFHNSLADCVAVVCHYCGFSEFYANWLTSPPPPPVSPPPAITCVKCGGPMQAVEVEGSDSSASVRFRKEWQGDFWRGPQFTRSSCAARVCAHCRYAEFYATAPGPLLGTDED
jgi:predicted nucleic-acid-binding Zn-ribbon protein